MWQQAIVARVLRLRYPIIAVAILLTALGAWRATTLQFDSDIEIWFLQGDPDLVTYHRFLDQFESDEFAVIGIFADDVFTPEILTAIRDATERARDVPHAARVLSLSNAKIIESRGAFNASFGHVMAEVPGTMADAQALRARVLDNVLLADNLVSRDGKATAILVELHPDGNSFDGKVAMVQALRRIAQETLSDIDVDFALGGSPVLDEAFFLYTERDFAVLGPAAGLVALLACLLLLRHPVMALLPLVVVGAAVAWTLGMMAVAGLRIDIISTSLFAVILAVGIADSVHLVSDYMQQIADGKPRGRAVADATAELIIPCLFTSLTTMAGFLSLMTSSLRPVARFGWLAASGVAFAFVLSMTLAPALLRVLPAPRAESMRRVSGGALSRLLSLLGRPTPTSSRAVLGVSVLLLVGAAVLGQRMYIGSNVMNYFKPGDPMRTDTARLDRALGGSGSMEFLVETPPGGLKEPATLARIDALTTRIERMQGVAGVHSVLEPLKETHRVLTDGTPASATLPDSRPMAAQFYMMIEGDPDFVHMVRGDYDRARMTARVRMSEAEVLASRVGEVIGWLRQDYDDDQLRITATGYVRLMSKMEAYLLSSQIRSLGLAAVVITLMMWLLLGSARLMALSMIPNFVPIALGLGFMALVGFALDPGTVMIGSIALGLVVDDTVHFLVRLRRNLVGRDMADAIAATMGQTGRPIILTSVILSAGFAVLGLGSFMPNVAFGSISAVVIVLALISDLVMLPAVLLLLGGKVAAAK